MPKAKQNQERMENIKRYAYSIISIIQEMNEFEGDSENWDCPFYKNIELIDGDVDGMKEIIEGIG